MAMAALLRNVLRRETTAAIGRFRAGFCSAVAPGEQQYVPPPGAQGEQFVAPQGEQPYEQPQEEYPEYGQQYAPPGYQEQPQPPPPPPQYEQYVPPPPPPPPPPKPRFNNANVSVSLVCLGRAMQLKFQNQKEFEQMLDKASAFGVMLPDEPGNITRELAELDPKKVYVVVDMKAALKYTKKLAMEEAEREGYPKDFMNFMNRNKYGKYESDDD